MGASMCGACQPTSARGRGLQAFFARAALRSDVVDRIIAALCARARTARVSIVPDHPAAFFCRLCTVLAVGLAAKLLLDPWRSCTLWLRTAQLWSRRARCRAVQSGARFSVFVALDSDAVPLQLVPLSAQHPPFTHERRIDDHRSSSPRSQQHIVHHHYGPGIATVQPELQLDSVTATISGQVRARL